LKKLVLAATLLALSTLSFAQTQNTPSAGDQQKATADLAKNYISPLSTSTAECSFIFTSGANNTFLKYCVTANGNIAEFQTPAGHEHIAVAKDGEGYGICDVTDSDSEVAYYDYAEFGDSGNWGTASVVSQTAKSVVIARTTKDGIWTLTQTITQVTTNPPSAKIAMKLQNNSNLKRTAIIVRYANVDADGVAKNNFDITVFSAFAWNSIGGDNPFGMMLQNVGTPSAILFASFDRSVPDGPNPCNLTEDGTLTATDGSLGLAYGALFPKGGSKTVTVAYRGL
jgi:hypothetical protein